MGKKGYYKNPLVSSKIFETLLLDGGWLTAEGLSLQVGTKPKSITKSLDLYVKRGWVEAKPRLDTFGGGTLEYRISAVALREFEA